MGITHEGCSGKNVFQRGQEGKLAQKGSYTHRYGAFLGELGGESA